MAIKDNKNISVKERNLIKGALRRVFARSDLRQAVMNAVKVENYSDPKRPRVKKWSKCQLCSSTVPTYTLAVDHKEPLVPTNIAFEDMTMDIVLDRLWCDINNLQAICETCHDEKTAIERQARKANKPKKIKTRKKTRRKVK